MPRTRCGDIVGRTPWSAAGPPAGFLERQQTFALEKKEPAGGPAADEGVRPTFRLRASLAATRRRARARRGAMSIQMLVLLVPVMFGLMGFGLDLGRLYLIRGELAQAAQAMAMAAAARLNGTAQGLTDATAAANATLDDSSGHGNKYNFGSLLIGG